MLQSLRTEQMLLRELFWKLCSWTALLQASALARLRHDLAGALVLAKGPLGRTESGHTHTRGKTWPPARVGPQVGGDAKGLADGQVGLHDMGVRAT